MVQVRPKVAIVTGHAKDRRPTIIPRPLCDSHAFELLSMLTASTIGVIEGKKQLDRFTAAVTFSAIVIDGFRLNAAAAKILSDNFLPPERRIFHSLRVEAFVRCFRSTTPGRHLSTDKRRNEDYPFHVRIELVDLLALAAVIASSFERQVAFLAE